MCFLLFITGLLPRKLPAMIFIYQSILKPWLLHPDYNALIVETWVTRAVLALLGHIKEQVKNALHVQQVNLSTSFVFTAFNLLDESFPTCHDLMVSQFAFFTPVSRTSWPIRPSNRWRKDPIVRTDNKFELRMPSIARFPRWNKPE